jgi:hypothetical protein
MSNESETIDRLRVTRQLTDSEYKKLIKYEEEHGELSVIEIAKMFKFDCAK